jgi:hypothetical protein
MASPAAIGSGIETEQAVDERHLGLGADGFDPETELALLERVGFGRVFLELPVPWAWMTAYSSRRNNSRYGPSAAYKASLTGVETGHTLSNDAALRKYWGM